MAIVTTHLDYMDETTIMGAIMVVAIMDVVVALISSIIPIPHFLDIQPSTFFVVGIYEKTLRLLDM